MLYIDCQKVPYGTPLTGSVSGTKNMLVETGDKSRRCHSERLVVHLFFAPDRFWTLAVFPKSSLFSAGAYFGAEACWDVRKRAGFVHERDYCETSETAFCPKA